MTFLGSAILAFWADVEPAGEADFNDWHTREHMPERVGVPGFLRGRRYVAVKGAPKYFMMYETESLGTLASPAYVERLNNPTPWTRKSLAIFRNSNRTACRTVASVGRGIGGVLATLRLGPRPGQEQALRRWLSEQAFPKLLERPGISGATLFEADVETTTVKTEEKNIRDKPDALARWVVLVEGIDTDIVERACREVLDGKTLASHGAEGDAILGVYRLHYIL